MKKFQFIHGETKSGKPCISVLTEKKCETYERLKAQIVLLGGFLFMKMVVIGEGADMVTRRLMTTMKVSEAQLNEVLNNQTWGDWPAKEAKVKGGKKGAKQAAIAAVPTPTKGPKTQPAQTIQEQIQAGIAEGIRLFMESQQPAKVTSKKGAKVTA